MFTVVDDNLVTMLIFDPRSTYVRASRNLLFLVTRLAAGVAKEIQAFNVRVLVCFVMYREI